MTAQAGGGIPSFSPCVQCGRCSAGCPVAFESADTPRKIIRYLQVGDLRGACESPFPWFCTSCQACSVRCPRGVDIAAIMMFLRREGVGQGWIKRTQDLSFYRVFLEEVRKKGRMRELGLGWKMALRRLPLHPWEDVLLLIRLWRKGKVG